MTMQVNSVPTQKKEQWGKRDADAETTSKLTVSLC